MQVWCQDTSQLSRPYASRANYEDPGSISAQQGHPGLEQEEVMPRIYTSANDPLDFCLDCFPTETAAIDEYQDVGDGPDGRGNCFTYEAIHPPYSDRGMKYRCHICKKELLDEDN